MIDTPFYPSTKLLGFIVMDTQHYKDFNFKGLQHVLFIVTTLKIEESKGVVLVITPPWDN